MDNFEAIDLFSGAGGMSLGAVNAGLTVSCAVELDVHAAATYQLNHPQTRLLREDIRRIDTLKHCVGHPRILFGGPPCQGYSTSNQRTRKIDNPKNWLFAEAIR